MNVQWLVGNGTHPTVTIWDGPGGSGAGRARRNDRGAPSPTTGEGPLVYKAECDWEVTLTTIITRATLNVAAIPGTKHRSYLEENLGALQVALSAEDLSRLVELAPRGAASGDRCPEQMMAIIRSAT